LDNDLTLALLVVGRVLLGGLYVVGGVEHFFALKPLTQALQSRGLPAARFCLIAGSVFQAVAGALLIVGLYVRIAALGLVVFTIVASVLLVNFWTLSGEARVAGQRTFQSNLAIIGGLLITAATASS
jgi:putative oxidoreductase